MRVARRMLAASWIWGACGVVEPEDEEDLPPSVALSDDNNYRFTSSLHIPIVETASGQDLKLCWGEVEADLRCHPVDPVVDVANVALLRIRNRTESEIEGHLSRGDLMMSDIDGYLSYPAEHVEPCTQLSSLTLLGTSVDLSEEYVESEERRYLLRLTEGTAVNAATQTMMFLRPVASSDVTEVEVPSGCGLLDFSADLVSSVPIALPPDGPWLVEWKGLTRDGQSVPIDLLGIDRALLAFYEGLTPAALQENILSLEEIATDMWSLDLSAGFEADLGAATHTRDGTAFTGLRPGGVWIVALLCGRCQNPAPVFLAVIEPREEME